MQFTVKFVALLAVVTYGSISVTAHPVFKPYNQYSARELSFDLDSRDLYDLDTREIESLQRRVITETPPIATLSPEPESSGESSDESGPSHSGSSAPKKFSPPTAEQKEEHAAALFNIGHPRHQAAIDRETKAVAARKAIVANPAHLDNFKAKQAEEQLKKQTESDEKVLADPRHPQYAKARIRQHLIALRDPEHPKHTEAKVAEERYQKDFEDARKNPSHPKHHAAMAMVHQAAAGTNARIAAAHKRLANKHAATAAAAHKDKNPHPRRAHGK